MFSALRQNSIVYILNKQGTPILKKGQVLSVSSPKPKVNGFYSNTMDMVVDVEVKVEDTKETFKNVPSNLTIVNDGNMVISETREAMCTEVESMLAMSKQVLDNISYHNKIVESCEEMLKELNPQFAKDREQEAKISALESKIGGIEISVGDIKQMLSQVLNK